MHTFHQYVLDQIAEKLKKHRVVVWYDPRAEFRPWIHELCGSEPLGCLLQAVEFGGLRGHVCVFHGSFFEVRLTVEPAVAVDIPEPLLVYVAAPRPDAVECPLAELEKSGETYEPQLKRLARTCCATSTAMAKSTSCSPRTN